MLFVLHNNQTNQVLLVVRSTVGSYEWTKNFECECVPSTMLVAGH